MDPVLLAQDTLSILDSGRYHGPAGPVDFGTTIRAAVDGTRVITPREAAALAASRPRDLGANATIEVTDEGTAEAARRLAADGPVTALNFASALSVGGRFLAGALAQEEDLCRCSALYPCLQAGRDYYRENQAQGGALYTDHALWSPAVPFFRGTDNGLLAAPFAVSVITSPAPNTTRVRGDEASLLAATFRRRAAQVLAIAASEPPTSLVLGAWGCGAFGGDAEVVAEAFARALDEGFGRAFTRIVFAVLVRRWPDDRNLEVFRARFA